VLSTANEIGDRPLTLPVAPQGHSRFYPGFPLRNQCRFPSLLVKETSFPDTECLPSTSCPPRSLSRLPRLSRDPPPISRFRHRRFGFRRSFATPTLACEAARPKDGSTGSSPVGAWGHTPLIDFCNRSDPRAHPQDRPNPAHSMHGRPGMRLGESVPFRFWIHSRVACTPFGVQPTEISRARGWFDNKLPYTTSRRVIAHGTGFAPTRSAQTPSVVRS